MDRRFDTRFPSDLQVRITDVENDSVTMTGTLLDLSVSGLCVLLPEHKTEGTVVKLDFAGTELYGYIAYSNEEDGRFRTGIAVERVLVQASDLSNILENILADTEPRVAPTRE